MSRPLLYVFAGLPGVGKTALSQRLAADLGLVHLRIDTIEQALRDLCQLEVGGEGYRLAYRLAADNLRLGTGVVADSCNPWELTRREWEATAAGADADFVNIEVVCSDGQEHRRRLETRESSVPGLVLPTWEEVVAREYHPWSAPRLVVDTAGVSERAAYEDLRMQLAALSDR